MSIRPKYPLLVGALVALLALSAGLARAQSTIASTEASRRVAVAARLLPRGTVLAADDIIYRDTTVRGPVDTSTVVAGWVTRRLIGAGEVLRMPAVERPVVVSANEPVSVEWADRNVMLTLRGVVTRSAALGERVVVRTELGRRIDATVIAPGRVRID
ncbi:MAG: flagellar basal body P-ring formation chaperone FlgA [Gemmatimonadaceae bacterium]